MATDDSEHEESGEDRSSRNSEEGDSGSGGDRSLQSSEEGESGSGGDRSLQSSEEGESGSGGDQSTRDTEKEKKKKSESGAGLTAVTKVEPPEELDYSIMDDDSVMEDDSIVEALGGDVASRDKASQNTKKDVGSRKKRGALVVVPRRRRDSAASAPRGKKLRGRGKAAHDMSSAPRSSKRASIEPERFGKQSKPETKLRSRKPVPPVPAATATPTTKKEKKFIVQKILDKKTMKRKVHYLVKWQGYPASQNTWELQETLRTDVPDLVNEFESKTKKGAATSESEPVRRGRGRPRVEPVEETVRVVDADRDSEDESLYYVIDRRGVKTRLSAEEARTNYPLALIDFYEQIVEFESD